MMYITRRSIAIALSALFISACGGGGGGGSTTPSTTPPATTTPPVTTTPAAATLSSITVTPLNPSTALNAKLQLVATGKYSDNTTKDITSSVAWSSGNTAIATVGSTSGLLTPVVGASVGQTVVITATSGVAATATVTLNALPTFSVASVSDPLTAQQWGLKNTAQNAYSDTGGVASTGTNGTDINVDPVYTNYGYTGYGVTVAVVDSGLEIAHEDLSANVVPSGSWDFVSNISTDPTSTSTTGDHGTSVAGLIAMAKNGKGGMGVAPNAQLKGFNVLASTQTVLDFVNALGGSSFAPKSNDVAIFNQSFGSSNTIDIQENTFVEAQYASGTSTLRGGKGALYVKSAGNGYSSFGTAGCGSLANVAAGGAVVIGVSCQNANFDPDNTLPYNIVVAALNANGTSASYSTAGSAIWASAPGGEFGQNNAVSGGVGTLVRPAMVTTDQSGCTKGYSISTATTSLFNKGGTNLVGVNASCNYTNSMNGTSSAAPMTSGVIALILEANPALTWREVKDILAKTAVQVDAARAATTVTAGMTGASGITPFVAEQGWVTNAAGYKFHNWYGFGAVNASAAVTMAKSYVSGSLGTFANTGWVNSGVLNLAVPDNSTAGVSTALTVPAVGVNGKVETVQIKVTTSATAGWTGDLGIELTSPSGTKSILKNIQDGFSSNNLAGMVLASNAFYGESSAGAWTIKVIDGWAAAGVQTVTNVQIRVYGH